MNIAVNGKSSNTQSCREPGPLAESPGGVGSAKVRPGANGVKVINESGTASLDDPPLVSYAQEAFFRILSGGKIYVSL